MTKLQKEVTDDNSRLTLPDTPEAWEALEHICSHHTPEENATMTAAQRAARGDEMKLTKEQQRVVDAMRDGAEWHECDCPFCVRDLWLKHKRLHVSGDTILELLKSGVLRTYGRYSYVLAPEWRDAPPEEQSTT